METSRRALHLYTSSKRFVTTTTMDSSVVTKDEGRKETKKRDAPGWAEDDSELGPVCWKCQGTGTKQILKKNQPPTVPCPVCHGKGRFAKKALRKKSKPTTRELPKDYVIPGPPCANAKVDVHESESVCALLGHWKIIQSDRGGHRWSTDDLITAWVACDEASKLPQVRNHLDLGCGIGSVLLMTSWFFYEQNPKGFGVEAQSVSADKARRNIVFNGVEERLQVINEDFRTCDSSLNNVSNDAKFDLVTGTPPYFPVSFDKETGVARPGSGALPTFEQSAPARYEFRGGLEDYFMTASRFVAKPAGLVVVCEGNIAAAPKELDRARAAADKSNLKLVRSVFVHGRDDKPPLFAVHVLLPDLTSSREFSRDRFNVRHVGGKRTEEYLRMCATMGIAPFPDQESSDETR